MITIGWAPGYISFKMPQLELERGQKNSIFPTSAIFDLAHVQIAVLNPALIKKCSLIEITGDT